MPTNRPFFANFLAAFRAHSAISKASSSSSSSTSTTTSASAFSPQSLTSRTLTTSTSTSPSPPPTKSPTPGPTTAAVQAANNHLSHTRHPSASPTSRSPPHPPSNFGRPQRRGSDSSGEGYRDVLGGEKWYVGGRTANGEERFYRLGMIRRERSGDRLSLDRLSL